MRTQSSHIHIGLRQQMAYRTTLLIQQGQHQVLRLNELMIPADSKALGIGQRHLELAGQFIHSHVFSPSP
jgi:hypothetical protein